MLKITLENTVLTLSFDRVSAANALNVEIYEAVHRALEKAATQDDVKVVVITGEGTRAFCSGADLKEFSDLDPVTAAHQRLSLLMRCFLELIDFAKPVIAAVQAPAVGAGLMKDNTPPTASEPYSAEAEPLRISAVRYKEGSK